MPSSMALIVVAVAVRLTLCRSLANSVVVMMVVVVVIVMMMMVMMVVMVVMVLRDLYFVAFGRLGPLLFRGFQDGWSIGNRLQQLGE
jgi:hypothetical protein